MMEEEEKEEEEEDEIGCNFFVSFPDLAFVSTGFFIWHSGPQN
jgi:hypothetical protein